MSDLPSAPNRPVWLAIILIVGVLVAAGTALSLHVVGADATATLAGAGTAFVATTTLCMAVWNFLAG